MSKATLFGCARVPLLLVSLALMAVTACVTRPLIEPPPIAAAETPAKTRAAILKALIESDYAVESERPGEIVARYSQSNWSMVVGIDYSDQVSVRYVSSENLDYGASNGSPVIRRGYNRRVKGLSKLIGKQIAVGRIGDDLPAVATPPPGEARPH